MSDSTTSVLGEDNTPIELTGSEQLRALTLSMAGQCRRTLDICGRQLDPSLFDNSEFAAAVKQMALGSRYAKVRLLVLMPELLYARGHQLLLVAQQLPTFIQVHVPSDEDRDFNEAIFIADETGFAHRILSDRYEGNASFSDRGKARELTRRFDVLWERSEVDQNFRRLSL
jgi:hypothetical protein